MARSTILDAAVQVLSADRKARTPKEIHEEIVAKGLYSFGAQDPVGMVRATLRKHLRSHGGAGQPASRVKRLDEDRYTLSDLK